jgi:hypothetical protein
LHLNDADGCGDQTFMRLEDGKGSDVIAEIVFPSFKYGRRRMHVNSGLENVLPVGAPGGQPDFIEALRHWFLVLIARNVGGLIEHGATKTA